MTELIQFIAEQTGKEITGETRLDSLVEDSLEFLELILEVQAKFDVKLPDELFPKLHTVKDLYGAMHGHVPA